MSITTGNRNSLQAEFGDSFKNRKVIVTGANGFIGGHLCEALYALGARLFALSIERAKAEYIEAESYIEVDLTDKEKTRGIISDVNPDLIYHLAGMVNASREYNLVFPMLYNNFISTVNVLSAATSSKCKRIVIAGTAEESNINASDNVPTSPYAASKMAGTLYSEMFYRLYDAPIVIVRPFITYGPRQNSSKLIPYTILSMLKGNRPIVRSGERICDFIYVLDLVRGLLKSGYESQLIGEIIELGTGVGTKIKEIINILAILTKYKDTLYYDKPREYAEEKALVANSKNIFNKINWEPHWTLQAGLKQTVEWYILFGDSL